MKKDIIILIIIQTLAISNVKALSIKEAIQESSANSPYIEKFIYKARESNYNKRAAVGDMLPSVTVSGSIGVEDVDTLINHNNKTEYNFDSYGSYKVEIEQEIFKGGRLYYNTKAKSSLNKMQDYELQHAKEYIALSATKAFLDIAQNKEKSKIAANFLVESKNISSVVKKLRGAGKKSITDVQEANKTISNAKASIYAINNSLYTSTNNLSKLLGRELSFHDINFMGSIGYEVKEINSLLSTVLESNYILNSLKQK